MLFSALIVAGAYAVYYYFKIAKKPVLVCSNSKFSSFLSKACPVLDRKFWPTFWAAESRLNTLARHFFQTKPELTYERQFLPLPDGGLVAFDWAYPEHFDVSSPIVVICPGLTGDSGDSYIRHVVGDITKRGFRVAVFIYRGNGDLPLKVNFGINARRYRF